MAKPLLTAILAVALIADVAIFVGVGFGLGALNLTTSQGQSYAPTWSNDTGGTGGALQPNVYVQLGTLPLISSMLPGAGSTTLTFGMQEITNNNCANAGQPAWIPGSSAFDPMYYTIQFIQSGNPIEFTALIDGQQQQGTTLVATNNGSWSGSLSSHNQYNFACGYVSGTFSSGNDESPALVQQNVLFLHTISITGLVGEGQLRITVPASGTLCGGTGGVGGDCANGYTNGGNGGTWSTHSSVSIPVLSAEASLSLDGSGPWFNGGQVQFTVSTGFAGPQGYSLEILNPTGRAGSGNSSVASGWGPTNPQSVQNDQNLATFTFTIPQGASINCTTAGCNNFQAVLVSPLLQQQIGVPVDISPFYAPTQPGISYSTSSGGIYPANGDSMTITVNAGSNGSNNQVSTFIVYVFYLLNGQSVTTAKACDSTWVTPCQGQSLAASSTGSTNASQAYSASFTFTVNPPINTVSIGIRVQAETHEQQSSAISYRQVSLLPAGCKVGTTCDPSRSNLSLWAVLAPILLSIAIVIAGLLGFLWLPGAARFASVIGAAAIVALLWVLGIYAMWFGGAAPVL